ncbi:hypothetical protein RirG_113620 [Rhizophagus irregularis DAOM 197198w]|uniref:Uncharacterized protein n=1 Tax=Rhizophagus irregularis (strain DAOM 197198w) TaxID=1432141 RepID=A0A015MKY5_RHIIW|nr:hypothetical protein RirG_113620 [Rhizophagus irregularis DAOM 197198w]
MEGVILSFAYLSENGKFFVLYYKFMHETKKKANGHRFRQGGGNDQGHYPVMTSQRPLTDRTSSSLQKGHRETLVCE